jgi:hypothetical protein
MAAALNLRGDLAKLSDAALAERLESLWARYDSIERLWGGSRTRLWIEWILSLVFNSRVADALMEAEGDPQLILCEVETLTDKMKCRVGSRESASAQ